MKIETAQAILKWEDNEDEENFIAVVEGEQTGKSRRHGHYRSIYQDKRDLTHWEISWSRGLTEMQDEGPEDINVNQVWPNAVTVTVFKREQPTSDQQKVNGDHGFNGSRDQLVSALYECGERNGEAVAAICKTAADLIRVQVATP